MIPFRLGWMSISHGKSCQSDQIDGAHDVLRTRVATTTTTNTAGSHLGRTGFWLAGTSFIHNIYQILVRPEGCW